MVSLWTWLVAGTNRAHQVMRRNLSFQRASKHRTKIDLNLAAGIPILFAISCCCLTMVKHFLVARSIRIVGLGILISNSRIRRIQLHTAAQNQNSEGNRKGLESHFCFYGFYFSEISPRPWTPRYVVVSTEDCTKCAFKLCRRCLVANWRVPWWICLVETPWNNNARPLRSHDCLQLCQEFLHEGIRCRRQRCP